jgi:hypothetical protein
MIPSMEKTPSEIVDVVVAVAVSGCLAEPNSVYDAGVIQRIADDGVLGTQERLEEAPIGIKTGGVKDRVFCSEKPGQAGLEFLVDRLGAADETDRGHAIAPAFQGFLRSLGDFGMTGQTQVIVRAEVDDGAAVG